MLKLKQEKRKRRGRDGRPVRAALRRLKEKLPVRERASYRKMHAAGLFFRRPYKLLICSLVNAVVILFAAVEGVQVTEMRSAMDQALESRFYTGTLTQFYNDSSIYNPSTRISEEAYDILSSSPYVSSVQTSTTHTARFGGKLRYVQYQAANYCMFVGFAASDLQVLQSGGQERQQFMLRPTYIAAGDPDTFTLKYGETVILPFVNFSHYDETLEVHRDQRVFLFAATPHLPRQNCATIRVFNPPEEERMYYPGFSFIRFEEPGEEELTDEEFALKVIRERELEDVARRLNDVVDMTVVLEIPTIEMFLPYRNDLMRVSSGRAITEEDRGKKVCMLPAEMMLSLRKGVGEKISLAVSPHDLSDGYGGAGLPEIFREYDAGDFAPMEEYEIIGTYSNDARNDLDGNTRNFFLHEILIPDQEDEKAYEPVSMSNFSYSVHKDDYESYLFETEPLLREAGYSVVMARPEYADVEGQLEDLRSKSLSTYVTSALALAAGLAIEAGSLLLFWRKDYLIERRLGADRREAGGIYVRVCLIVFAISTAFSALAVLYMSNSKSIPVLTPESVAGNWKLMAALGAAELLLCAAIVFFSMRAMDRRKMGGGE